jgi:hypothetical protein
MNAATKRLLQRVGLLYPLRSIRYTSTSWFNPRERDRDRRFQSFKRQYGNILRHHLTNHGQKPRFALVASAMFPEVEGELGLIKGLELAGLTPVILISRDEEFLTKYYKLAGLKEVHFWRDFADPLDYSHAEAVLARHSSSDELLSFEYDGARVGALTVSTALRETKSGWLELESAHDREVLLRRLATSLAYARAAQRIIRQFQPELAVFADVDYTPAGELFDNCLGNAIEAVQWQATHKSNAIMLKRYSLCNRDQFNRSLSSESWNLLCNMSWTDAHREQLDREIHDAYASGDWYSVCGTQFDKRIFDPKDLRQMLGLDPNKKTAIIFPHVLWDATLFGSKPLFRNFEEWCVETVRAACANDKVNWIVKIHPSNTRVRERDFQPEPAEVVSLRKHIGTLPPHVVMMPAESEISTYSLFPIMDYCVTVCGTVGVESARLGIPVVTGGKGLYDHKGFTVDSESREEYLEKLRHIQDIPRLSADQRELAERFAYGLFVLRPWLMKSVTLKYHNDSKHFITCGQVNIKSREDWQTAPDLKAFADWIMNTDKPEDFLANLAPETVVAR